MSWLLDIADLAPFAEIDEAKAAEMIQDATYSACLVAPCLEQDKIGLLSETQAGAAKAIIRGAILRWNESGTGAVSQQTAGPFSATTDTRQERRGMFWPSEIQQLQRICSDTSKGGAFQIDTISATAGVHAEICSLNFGALYCSCGAVLAGVPLYELDP